MKTAGTAGPGSAGTSTAASNESTCRPNALRRTVMSMAPRLYWSGRPSSTWSASRIMPAQVPKIGIPCAIRSSSGSVRSLRPMSMPIVVDSPPGMISA
ncbi:MAG: hypothetical protein V9G10_06665 [Candidatus Nanopelagicales bacterium]